MALLVPNAELVRTLELRLNISTPEDLQIRLYSNNYTPVSGSTAGDFTQATFTGYSAVTIDEEDWDITSADPAVALLDAAVEFTSTAGSQNQDIYGYYIVGVTSGRLIWAERFTDGPYNIANLNDKISVTPRITLGNA